MAADFYTNFAFFLDKEIYGEDVLKDIRELMKIMDKIDDCQNQDFPEWFDVDTVDGHGCKFEMDNGGLYISHEESGNPETIADIIRQALKHNNSDACVGFQYAFTCSKPIPDEFGGDAVFITKDDVEWSRNYLWLSRKIEKHMQEQQAAPTP
jgi:hypothetical protein